MQLAVLRHKPYGFEPADDVTIIKSDNKRFTMRDIGAIEKRLGSVEYYTSLTLLENDARNVKAFDADGFDRLKNGFMVDDFTDHGTSDTDNIDYKCSLDFTEGILRPSHYTTNVALEWSSALSTNVNKPVANILTLPWVEQMIINQPYASRMENVNPFNVFTFIGRIDLTPASDDWTDTRRAPVRVTSIEGNFQATRRRLRVNQQGFAPVQWRGWRTAWTGTRRSGTRTWREQTFARGVPRRVLRGETITTTRRQVRSCLLYTSDAADE